MAEKTDLKAEVLNPRLSPFEQLCCLMKLLRSPEGCSWDRAQTHKSLIPYLIEETYEVVEAIESGDDMRISEELGDLLCQIVFHAQIASERSLFEINDSVRSIINKLLERHPHVFEKKSELAPGEVRNQWEKIKKSKGDKKSILDGLPRVMPALSMAYRIGEKAAGVGFDWDSAEDAFEKVSEEICEVRQELNRLQSLDNTEEVKKRLSEEIGDLLFAISSLSRKCEIDPETALRQALEKFRSRFGQLQREVETKKGDFDDYSLDELEEIWQKIKKNHQIKDK